MSSIFIEFIEHFSKLYFSTGQKIRQDKQDEQDYFIFHHGKS